MRVEFYSGSVALGASDTLQISVRLWPNPSVRFWHRPVFQRWRNVFGSHGYVVPIADGWTADGPFRRFTAPPPGKAVEYYRGPTYTYLYTCRECGSSIRLDRGRYICPDHQTVLFRERGTGRMRRLAPKRLQDPGRRRRPRGSGL